MKSDSNLIDVPADSIYLPICFGEVGTVLSLWLRLSLFYQRIGTVRLLYISHGSTSILLGYGSVIVLGVRQFYESAK